MKSGRRGESTYCTYPGSVPHSFIAPRDQPTLDKPYLRPFTTTLRAVLGEGTPFEHGACPGPAGAKLKDFHLSMYSS